MKPGKLTITVESDSSEHMAKLLEQALYELRASSTNRGPFAAALKQDAAGKQEGTMGRYSFEYTYTELVYEEADQF